MLEFHELRDTNTINPFSNDNFDESKTLSAKLRVLVDRCNVTGRTVKAMTTTPTGTILVITETV